MATTVQRRFPIGAEPVAGGVHFRVWAPVRKRVDVVLEEARSVPMEREPGGYFSKVVDFAQAGMQYRFRLDCGDRLFPDPASRFQPEGPHGPSQIVHPSLYCWKDDMWKGLVLEGQVIYETHIGTLTSEGTWTAARQVLPDLAEDGITALEVMPVAEFPGEFGWGYDGTALFAPTHLYGTPEDFRGFVDRAHSLGLGVILDVVYNHLGPDGNYLKEFAPAYFTDRYANEWGEAVNFDGPDSAAVREMFLSNAAYWVQEFHLDGLRLDATQQIFDNGPRHILAEINREARRAAGARSIVIIAENERQDPRVVQAVGTGGYGLDATWNDDFHHSIHVAVTGRTEAYYTDYSGTPQELISLARWGFLYQGQFSIWQRQRRGHPAIGVKGASFLNYIQNHDQVANSAYGSRLHELTSPGRYKAVTALLLLLPGTPLLFQGQEFGASSPFVYFADHQQQLAVLVQQGRAEFLDQFSSIAQSQTEFALGRPQDRRTFEQCKLNYRERKTNAHIVALHRDLLKLRREDPVFSAQRSDWIHGAVLGADAFVLRFLAGGNGDRLLFVNLGRDLLLRPAPEPLLAPTEGARWEVAWSSDDPPYRGSGRPPMRKGGSWNIPGQCAVVMYETSGH
jgi:maltooligosyltrehalose trehalohydrolase